MVTAVVREPEVMPVWVLVRAVMRLSKKVQDDFA
jgi:hypothetical protein